MKKTLKSILAVTLALILSFGTLTAFAETSETLEWYFEYDEVTLEYEFFGELTEGVNEISTDSDVNSRYYTMDTKAGYYLFSKGDYSQENFIWNVITPEEIRDGIAYNAEDTILDWWEPVSEDSEEELGYFIYKFDAGETIIGVDVITVPGSEAPELTIEYLGECITDFDVKEKEFVLGYDVYIDSEGWISSDLTLSFSGGKTIDAKNVGLEFTCGEIVEGENTLTFEIDGFEKDFIVTVNSVDHYIKSAELSNAEKYSKLYIDYNGEYWYYPVNDEVVTVTFTDSTQKDVFINDGFGYVEFPNGKEYPVFVYIDCDYDDNCYLYIVSCEKVINKYEGEITKYNFIENGDILADNNKYEFEEFLNDLYWGLNEAFMYNTIADIFNSLFGTSFDTLIGISDLFNDLFRNIMTFIKFYLVG